ncbi:uncharacterized protein LOC110713232 isoform X1 [Chenopodium quinoa]|uniref:uncharacterized protein LOC110713232 isoform X1 n=2 Tax=Chenopodium quinoa TaxID=63459 RepID=UPI000B785325|nr:uncharacterized protein LOC110713232 isoform X1 [Chenopodium quinoa]
MNFKLLSPLRNRLHTLLRSDVAWSQRRYLGTAATATATSAQEIPNKRRTGKRIPADERKAKVEAYVNKYRVMNSGKFPTTKNVTNQIGGSHYKTKVIIQELEYKSKLPTVARAADKLTILQKAHQNQISEVKAIVDCKLSGKDKRNTVVDDTTSAECYLSYESDKISDQKMIDMSTLIKNHEITAEYESGSEKKADLKLWGEHGRASADMDKSENSRILESCIVPVISTVMESTLASVTLIATSTVFCTYDGLLLPSVDDFESPAKSDHSSEVSGMYKNTKSVEVDETSGQAFESNELIRCKVTCVGEISTSIDSKKQVSNPDSAYVEKLVRNEKNKTGEVEKTLDCQVRVGRTVSVDDYHVSAEDDSSDQKEVDNYNCQRMISNPILIKGKEVAVEDICGSEEMTASSAKATATEDSAILLMPSHRIEVPKTSQNATIGNLDEASAPASKCDKLPRVTTTKKHDEVDESQQSSLWGSLKFFASNVISRWQKT